MAELEPGDQVQRCSVDLERDRHKQRQSLWEDTDIVSLVEGTTGSHLVLPERGACSHCHTISHAPMESSMENLLNRGQERVVEARPATLNNLL